VGKRRAVGLVVTLVGVATLISITGLLVLYLIVAREPPVSSSSTLVMRVGGELHEVAPADVVGQFLEGAGASTVRGLVENIRKAEADARIAGLLIVPSTLELPFWGKVQELRDAVLDFKRSGKPTIAFLEYGGDREYYLATACDRIFLLPTAQLEVNGLASYELFLRGTLDKIGAFPDMMHIGEYKTAPNQLTEKTFTPAHRETAESLNHDMFEQIVRDIATSRRKSEAEVRAMVDEGPFLPEDAVRVGLVDDLAYEDQIDDKVKIGAHGLTPLEADEYAKVSATSLGLNKGPRIAVIYAVGMIVPGESTYDAVNGQILGSDTLVEHLRQARADASIRAMVLRVDSPGGSPTASDVIWRELMVTRHDKPDRPLVVSMSDLAASGGYYIAMPGQVVVAQPGTLTGSIGIYMGKIVTGGTFNKLGANIEAVSEGKNAEMNSPTRPYNAAERAKIQEYMQAFYDQFVEKAAQARHMTPERVDQVAQGRVWTGRQAKQVGLVDELGGLDRAIAVAKQRAKIAPDAEVELVIYPPRKSFYELVAEQFRTPSDSVSLGALLGVNERRALGAIAAPLRWFRRGEPLALLPFTFLR
jgi:protease-4